jgi:hypothetical protein
MVSVGDWHRAPAIGEGVVAAAVAVAVAVGGMVVDGVGMGRYWKAGEEARSGEGTSRESAMCRFDVLIRIVLITGTILYFIF